MNKQHLLLVFVASCGWLPPDSPATKPAPPDELAHVWVIENHILGGTSTLSEADATEMHGRKVAITTSGYTSPWQGSCEEAAREKRTRQLGDLTLEIDLPGDSRKKLASFGITDPVTEYRMLCGDRKTRTPPLTMWVSGAHALTCFGGVCYLLDY